MIKQQYDPVFVTDKLFKVTFDIYSNNPLKKGKRSKRQLTSCPVINVPRQPEMISIVLPDQWKTGVYNSS